MPKISIIIPVYNAENTLRRCVDSILAQAFTDFEVLLVDDGSRDSSPTLCDEYAAADARFKVIHKENGGVSSARNVGLDKACGEWICFVDSDDTLADNALSIVVGANEEDIVCGVLKINDPANNWDLPSGVYGGSENLKPFYEQNITHPLFHVVWGKLYRRDILQGQHFDESITIGEDTLFFLQCLKRVKRLRVSQSPFYEYDIPENFQSKHSISVEESVDALGKIYDAYLQLGIHNVEFERDKFLLLKSLCQESIGGGKSSLWYHNKAVKRMYASIKGSLTMEYRLRYFLMSQPAIAKLKQMLKKATHRK